MITISRNPRGAALFVALEVIFLVAGISVLLVESANIENVSTDSLILETQATYLAESGAEHAIMQITQAIASKDVLPAPFLAGWSPDASMMRGWLPGFEPPPVGAATTPTVAWKVFQLEAAERIVSDPDGVDHAYQLYAVTARAIVPDPRDPNRFNEAYINKIIDLDKIPLFQ